MEANNQQSAKARAVLDSVVMLVVIMAVIMTSICVINLSDRVKALEESESIRYYTESSTSDTAVAASVDDSPEEIDYYSKEYPREAYSKEYQETVERLKRTREMLRNR